MVFLVAYFRQKAVSSLVWYAISVVSPQRQFLLSSRLRGGSHAEIPMLKTISHRGREAPPVVKLVFTRNLCSGTCPLAETIKIGVWRHTKRNSKERNWISPKDAFHQQNTGRWVHFREKSPGSVSLVFVWLKEVFLCVVFFNVYCGDSSLPLSSLFFCYVFCIFHVDLVLLL